MHVNDLLKIAVDSGASDLHLTTGAPPMVRLDGQLAALPGMDVLTPDSLRRSSLHRQRVPGDADYGT